MFGAPLLMNGPKAGYTANLECYRLPSGDWAVVLSLTLDIHGREDEHHRQQFPECMDAYACRDRLAKSIADCSRGPMITPITEIWFRSTPAPGSGMIPINTDIGTAIATTIAPPAVRPSELVTITASTAIASEKNNPWKMSFTRFA